ncbi:hypothetical protein IWW35_004849 [Coemansia sp. RSA 1878]|nr:hypothetical protein IWW35_004849 [Coemansia sp. RSA 1878]
MKTYRDLPSLVTAEILDLVFSGADGDLDVWKQALPLLSVCHAWRVYGKNCLYRHAIVELVDPGYSIDYSDEEDHDYPDGEDIADLGGSDRDSISLAVYSADNAVAFDGDGSIRVYTNIQLIETLGLGSMVKQLFLGEKQSDGIYNDQVGSLKSFMSILETMFHDLPGDDKITEPFIKWYELEYMDAESGNDTLNLCHVASKAAADTLVYKFPNVSSINFMVFGSHEFFQQLNVELAVGYDKQLTKFDCAMPATYPYTLTAPNLVELDLLFSSSSHQNLPTIFPQSLQRINISLDKVLFSWDMFCIGNESKATVFDNLVNLSISSAVQFSGPDNLMNANDLDLVFPSLERLHLKNISLTKKDAKAMVGRWLKRLNYEGSIIAASQLCKQPLGNLDELYLSWLGGRYPDETDDFVSLTNEIFNKTDGIEQVHCDIYTPNYARCMIGIDWPYLTHLSMSFIMPFKELLRMLPKVPNLVCLDMTIGYCSNSEFAETIELLTNIKQHYPEPSSSKITTLSIAVDHDEVCEQSSCQKSFNKAIENLKWYWPQLKDIDSMSMLFTF